MDTATDLATKAADPFLQQGTLGATIVALAVALVCLAVFHWWTVDRKDKKIAELEKGWRDDVRTFANTIATTASSTASAVSALERAEIHVLDRGGKR